MERFYNLMALELSGRISEPEKKELDEILTKSEELARIALVLRQDWQSLSNEYDKDSAEKLLAKHQMRMKDKGII
ncbi:hypothetical protein SAMN05660461_6014 [Chitinophaga ginsengisegetis]|uniref:Uncharacterized protein n=1 Tax=Chitinophaga ginsengisegetis TaxID=393003 RepID=A0A1T5PBJ2_9BACT|nr:hypothetical protein [Chitinophaga ginsengisegetis]SKD10114.1 hypothetical protein SAMN05660461_6014 [Chitinophaga ginsengisegetis]